MANRLDKDETLKATYVLTSSQYVQKARAKGRERHTAKYGKKPLTE